MIAELGSNALIEEWEIIDLLDSLIAKSLVFYEEVGGQPRYRLLESVREYSVERLHASPDGDSRRARHLDFYQEFLELEEPSLRSPEKPGALRRIGCEHENLRTALVFADEVRESDCLIRLAANLWWYWYFTGHSAEAQHWLRRAINGPNPVHRPAISAKALCGLAATGSTAGDICAAVEAGEQSIQIYREASDNVGLAYALIFTALALLRSGSPGKAMTYSGEGTALIRANGNPWDVAFVLAFHGYVLTANDALHPARSHFKESASTWRAVGDKWGLSLASAGLGLLAAKLGDYRNAVPVLAEAIEIRRDEGDRRNLAEALNVLGEIERRRMNFREARDRFREALGLYYILGDVGGTALALCNLAQVARCECRDERAATLFAAASEDMAAIGDRPSLTDPNELRSYIASTRNALGREAFAVAWDKGQTMGIEAAVRFAAADSDNPIPTN